MRIVVLGLGSMGKRHIRLVREMSPNYKMMGIDGRTEGKKQAGYSI